MAHPDRDPISKPGNTSEEKRTRRNSGRFVVMLIGGVAVAAFCLYLAIVIWGVTSST